VCSYYFSLLLGLLAVAPAVANGKCKRVLPPFGRLKRNLNTTPCIFWVFSESALVDY